MAKNCKAKTNFPIVKYSHYYQKSEGKKVLINLYDGTSFIKKVQPMSFLKQLLRKGPSSEDL